MVHLSKGARGIGLSATKVVQNQSRPTGTKLEQQVTGVTQFVPSELLALRTTEIPQ
jgi:hypothetical protein